MVLLVANYYGKWDPQISIIANSTSIALAVIAIFLSLKQDSDSKSISESMRQDFTTQMGNITMLLANKKNEIDDAATNVEEAVDTNTETRNESYTYEQLVEHGEKIKQETINQFKKEMNEKILEQLLNIENNPKYRMDAYREYLNNSHNNKFESEIIKILKGNPDYTTTRISNELRKNDINVPKDYIHQVIKKFKDK